MKQKQYIAIDLKSFYASVECVERNLDPLTTNLVVADESRTDKTICLAVSPSLKAYGLPGRCRLFEVRQKVKGDIPYIIAKPRMQLYMDYSTRIYNIYLRYIAPEDIHVYSVDEVFIDATQYLPFYHQTAQELAMTMIKTILKETGITATAGIGTNLYLAKIAMDIEAKHATADENGVRMAYLDETLYKQKLWGHTPLTSFWRVGPGIAKKLAEYGIFTMGDIARCSLGAPNDFYNEELLYKLFGINAELLIDHAWGYEPTTIDLIKSYKSETNSISTGQVLPGPYDYEKTRLIVREMTDLLVYDLVEKRLLTDQIVLTIGYDKERPKDKYYDGPMAQDRYGRNIPKQAHGSINLGTYSSSTQLIMEKTTKLFEEIMNPNLYSRRIYVVANHVLYEQDVKEKETQSYEQLDLFTDYEQLEQERNERNQKLAQERSLQEAMLNIKKKYGKNAILKGMNLEEGGTTIERNREIGGHKA